LNQVAKSKAALKKICEILRNPRKLTGLNAGEIRGFGKGDRIDLRNTLFCPFFFSFFGDAFMSVTRVFALILGIGLVAAPLAQAQRPGGFGGGGFGGGGGGNVISTEAVQKELGLSTEQTDKLKLITEEAQKSMRELFGQRPAEGEDREKAREAMREKMTTAAKEITSKVEAVLTPEQKKRLKEIQLQAQGTRALLSDDVVTALKITDEQKKKIEEIREANRPQFGRPGQGGDAGGRGGFERFQEQQKETEAKIMEVLTAEQKTSLESMKGKKFDMPRPTFGGNRPGGNRPEGGARPEGSGGGDQPKPTPRPEPEL